ncbi:hypothetical protein [Luteimonas sp. SDU101]|uniref:hypothetical protein n=1 Tax=Luteimonas sp. SDU101 TaxID=3422593 RepID=UPI003EB968F9
MEDALSLNDAAQAAIAYRIVRTNTGVVVEPGTSNDHLLDLQQSLAIVRVFLERGNLVSVVV